jgi:hypothetical protein
VSSTNTQLVDVIGNRVVSTIRDRGEGHCLQVAHLSHEIADAAAALVHSQLDDPDAVALVQKQPTRPWHAKPTKIVELRNMVESTGGRLVIFMEAGQHVAAEDSFGDSTVELLDLRNIYPELVDYLLSKLEGSQSDLALTAETICSIAKRDAKYGVGDVQTAAFLGRLVENPVAAELGPALAELGLLPDTGIGRDLAEIPVRMDRNRSQMARLTDSKLAPAERIRALPLDRGSAAGKQIATELMSVLQDGTSDPVELGKRLGESEKLKMVDFNSWPLESAEIHLHELRIVQLIGDLSDDVVPAITKANASVGVKFKIRPAAAHVNGLKELKLELLRVGEHLGDVAPAGRDATKRGNQLPSQSQAQWKLKLPSEAEHGTYVLRLRAYNEDNLLLREDTSDPFSLGEVEEVVPRADSAPTLLAAFVAAKSSAGSDLEISWPPRLVTKGDGDVSVAVRFEGLGRAWILHRSPLLAEIEKYSLENPDTCSWNVSLTSVDSLNAASLDVELPAAFLEARKQVFDGLIANQLDVDVDPPGGPAVCLADLSSLGDPIRLYAEAWGDAIAGAASADELRALLTVDQVVIEDAPGGVDARLIGPTHPLRLLWLSRYHEAVQRWLDESTSDDAELTQLARLVSSLLPANVPNTVLGQQGALRHLEPLDVYWGLWGGSSNGDTGGLVAFVRGQLGLDRSGPAGLRAVEIVRRIRRYLIAHPYANLLTLNFVQPGSGRLILDTLLTLQEDPPTQDLRYVVRLFAKDLPRWEIGSALDEFMANPEAGRIYKREAVDAFLASSDDPLAPKITYSKHDVSELLEAPAKFPAHLTVFLDWFDLDIVPASPIEGRRSFFAQGLVVEPFTAFSQGTEGGSAPVWDQQVSTADDDTDALHRVYSQEEQGVARALGAGAPGMLPAVRLSLDRVRRSIFDGVHRHSDWVVTIDPVFTDEFLDVPPRAGETNRYLLDYVEPSVLEVSRRIMVSTRSRGELERLFEPVSQKYSLSVDEERVSALLEALQILGAGLPLKLLNNRTQALEALTLALGSLFLADHGVFRHGFVLPLDAHQALFREAVDWRTEAGTDLRRTDLAVIRPDPTRRLLSVNLVELKARGSLPQAIPSELIGQIQAQLDNTHTVLRQRLFGVDQAGGRGSLASGLQARRLMKLLTRYLDRSVRFGFLADPEADKVRRFLTTLDDGYELVWNKTAVIFDLEGDSAQPVEVDGVEYWRVGRTAIDDLLERAPTRLGTRPFPERSELFERTPGTSEREAVLPVTADVPVVQEPNDGTTSSAEADSKPTVRAIVDEGIVEGPELEEVMLIGATSNSAQFGIIGVQAGTGRPVAVDLDGTNVLSVFGLQGAGKSYTVGTLLEAALIPDHHLNRLPKPLAGVVFHYSTDRRYAPEFASMATPNDDSSASATLIDEFNTSPSAVSEVAILVPPDLVEERQREFPDASVYPIFLGPQELTLDDWRLLMGLEGGDQVYARAMNTIFRQLRNDVTIGNLKSAIEASRMNQAQKDLALLRVEFVEAFVADGADITSHIRPGRLVIVDLRDPYIEEDQALALFMVLLGRFGEVDDPSVGAFNKLIVFDEAHKYMRNEGLTTAIVDSGRLMRHTGTSIVMASQDPPSVPKKVIELSTIIICHRMTSPPWLDHLRKANEAFGGGSMSISMLAGLPAGQAFIWARDGNAEFRRPQRVRMRPRLTKHGGATKRATR